MPSPLWGEGGRRPDEVRPKISARVFTLPSPCNTSPLRKTVPPGNVSAHGAALNSRRNRWLASATAGAHDA